MEETIESARGRLRKGAVESFRWGIAVTNIGFQVGDRMVSLREEWFKTSKAMTKHLKEQQAVRLACRRPNLFSGLPTWNHKQHASFFALLRKLL